MGHRDNNRIRYDGARPRSVAPRSRLKRLTAALTLVVVAATATGSVDPARAQESIDDARERREATRVAELEAEAALDVLDAELGDIQAAFDAANELVDLVDARVEAVEAQLELAELRLSRTKVAIAWAEYDRDQIDGELADLAVDEYLNSMGLGGSLLTEADLREALTRNAVVEIVQGAGRNVIDTAREAADRNEELQAKAELEVAEVERLEADLAIELEGVKEARQVRSRVREALRDRRSFWQGKADELEAEEERLSDFIRAEQRRIDIANALDAAEAAQSAEGYVWPTDGRIGSYYGYRVHPVLGYSRLHAGLDIGGAWGQPIWAAKEGQVILAGVNGGYGNTIVVDHGNGFATLYAHQTSFEVSKGDWVETGQHIGNVGSTGLSTGPHLHFEVRINGDAVDPIPYLPSR